MYHIRIIAYRDIKKVASYQVILSIGFVILGLGSNTFAGVHGAIFYLANDIIVKTMLFFIGSLVYMSGYREYKYLCGLAKKNHFWCCICCYDICDWRRTAI